MSLIPRPDEIALQARAKVHAALGDPYRLALVEALALTDLTPRDASQGLGIRSNLLAHHVNVLEDAGLLLRKPSQGDGRRRYLRLNLTTLEDLFAPAPMTARQILFVCTANAARSQLAAAIWGRHSPVPAESAGAFPGTRIAEGARQVAERNGYSLEGTPRGLSEVEAQPDLVISVCDRAHEGQQLQIRGEPFTGRMLHWSIDDPELLDEAQGYEDTFDLLHSRIRSIAPSIIAA